MKFSIEDFFSKCKQIRWKLRTWSHLLKKSLMANFIFCAMPKRLVRGKKYDHYILTACLFILLFIKCGHQDAKKKKCCHKVKFDENFLEGWKPCPRPQN